MLDPAKTYVAQVYTRRYTFLSGAGQFPYVSNGITAEVGRLTADAGPDVPAASYFENFFFVSPIISSGAEPVSATLDFRWAVNGSVVATTDLRWAVRSSVTATADFRWAVAGSVTASLDLRWALGGSVSSSLDLRWAVLAMATATVDLRWAVLQSSDQVSQTLELQWISFGRVLATLDLRWVSLSDAPPVTIPSLPLPRLAAGELQVMRRNTRAFILADPRIIILQRRTRALDAAGGIERGPLADVPAQVFRLLPQEDGATARVTAEGETATPEYMLLGMYDVDMQRWDVFEFDGRRYQILWISENRQYQVKGEVIHLG